MPEYLAPGVYVEEVSFRSRSIEGVSTTTTGFIGPTRYGPTDLPPDVLTSLLDFEHIYGDGQQLSFLVDGATSDTAQNRYTVDNYMWHAVRAFFEEGGKRLYVVRAFRELTDKNGVVVDSHAKASLPPGSADDAVLIEARFPGDAGAMRLQLTLSLGQNVLALERNQSQPDPNAPDAKLPVAHLQDFDLVWISSFGSPIGHELGATLASPLQLAGALFTAHLQPDPVTHQDTWFFFDQSDDLNARWKLSDFHPGPGGEEIRVVTLTVTALPTNPFDLPLVWANIPLDPRHTLPGPGAPDAFDKFFAAYPTNLADAYRLPIVVTAGAHLTNGVKVLNALLATAALQPGGSISTALGLPDSSPASRSFLVSLDGGNDGKRPGAEEYEGKAQLDAHFKSGLKALEDIDDISIVAAPGSTFALEDVAYKDEATTIVQLLLAHAELMRYRIAVIDSGDNQTVAQVREMRGKIDSKYGALYYPWVRILDPITRREINLPPSGFVTGIYARNDITRAVYKAPANEVVNLALGFETMINKGQQDVLNPEGVNCFRFFEGRGFRLWGARTTSSDPEWKYVNLRRYFAYLEHSIDKGTQWAVFEPNGELLWANVRRTIEDFLFNEWQSGALLGDKPEKAFFVRCDRSTMTQNDLDNGRLVCLIGVVALRPAEYVIFRIGQATADSLKRAA
jgi:phage tail sheath protein FI